MADVTTKRIAVSVLHSARFAAMNLLLIAWTLAAFK
jgi:hypothetical protein